MLLTAARQIHESLQLEATGSVDSGQPRWAVYVSEMLVVVQSLAEATIHEIILSFDPGFDVNYPDFINDSLTDIPEL